MRPISILLIVVCAGSLLAQKKPAEDKKPALITRKQYAESNLLFSWQRDIGQGFEVTQSCIRIHPSGNFHRETSKGNSKPKFAEIGKLSDSELAELKKILDDDEFKRYWQDPEGLQNHVIGMQVGYQIFSVSIYRVNMARPQELLFINDAKTTAEPQKVQLLHQRLHDLQTREDSSLQRVTPDGCHAYPVPQPQQQP